MRETPTLGNTTAAASLSGLEAAKNSEPVPGVVLIFAEGAPNTRLFRAPSGTIELGRMELRVSEQVDALVSRKHVRLAFDGSGWELTDLGSRNGTFVGGARITTATRLRGVETARVGGTVLMPVCDIVPFERFGVGVQDGMVCGPTLRSVLDAITLSQRVGLATSLMIRGETGTGKELAARAFHAAGGKPNAPFCAVNCATIPKELAERLLFGSRRGAYSGATDAGGYVQAAHGGTLFLDEVAELSPEVQSKLLRMLETREVMRLGATSYESVDVRVCAASWRNLRDEVAAGRFREDLYFRVGQPELELPPLRGRREEVPWHVQQVLVDCSRGRTLSATAAFVEACCARFWPGNVRELRAEVRLAAASAVGRGSDVVEAEHLGPTAGTPLVSAPQATSAPALPQDEVATALTAAGGNVAEAARQLGVHRNKIRRWLERHTIDPRSLKGRGAGR